jgi:hypothetical protein
MKFIKISLLLFFISLAHLQGYASNELLNAYIQPITTESIDACELPAPTGLTTSDVTTTGFTAKWSPVTGNNGYEVKLFKLEGINLNLISTNIQDQTLKTFTGLTPGETYQVQVRTRCSNGQFSSIAAILNVTLQYIVIEEIVILTPASCNPHSSTPLSLASPTSTITIPLPSYPTFAKLTIRVSSVNPPTTSFMYLSKISETKIQIKGCSNSKIVVSYNTVSIDGSTSCSLRFSSNGLRLSGQCNYNLTPNITNPLRTSNINSDSSIDEENEDFLQIPQDTKLETMPNPFSNSTTIKFRLAENTNEVSLQLYDIHGRLVQTVLPKQAMLAGEQVLDLDASSVSKGVYTLILRTKDRTEVTRLIKME